MQRFSKNMFKSNLPRWSVIPESSLVHRTLSVGSQRRNTVDLTNIDTEEHQTVEVRKTRRSRSVQLDRQKLTWESFCFRRDDVTKSLRLKTNLSNLSN